MKIQQEITFKSGVQRVFEALSNSKQFSELSGAPAEINSEPGGKFTCFGGMITGRTIEIQPPELLVQAWRVGNWNPGVYSIIKFEFEAISDNETKLNFEHIGFPEDQKTHLESGWYERYWEPLKIYLK